MKQVFFVLILFKLTALSVLAQDSIIKRSQDTLVVKIVKSTPDLVEFSYPEEDLVHTEYKNAIDKIIYSSGRIEVCATKHQLQKIFREQDWEKVIVTYTETDIKGLERIAMITKTSGWGGTLATGVGHKDAVKKLQKEAAKKGASIVWITNNPNQHTTAYGAGVKLTAVAYK